MCVYVNFLFFEVASMTQRLCIEMLVLCPKKKKKKNEICNERKGRLTSLTAKMDWSRVHGASRKGGGGPYMFDVSVPFVGPFLSCLCPYSDYSD